MHHELVNRSVVAEKQTLCVHLLHVFYRMPSAVATAVAFVFHTDPFRGHSSLARGLWHSPTDKGCKWDSHQMYLKGKLKI